MGTSEAVKKRAPALPPPRVTYHKARKLIHFGCFLGFLALPFCNLMRFDIPRQRFYFAGYELWINEFAIIFFALMFLMFLVIGSSVFYGRVYCGYMCPQMIFSEASLTLQNRLRRWINKRFFDWPATRRAWAAHLLFLAALAPASIFLAFAFISYFVPPGDLFHRLLALDLHTAGGISGAAVTLITFLDFTLVRQRFCTTVCPYGYLQGILGDNNTLLVHYRDEGGQCIECKKCVRICHMGIDIRKSPFQIECVHCGECIDACVDVLGRLGKKGLIHYTWGEHGGEIGGEEPWYRRVGIRDAKRVIVLVLLLCYGCGLFVALSMRRAVLIQISPERATLYRVDGGRVYNRFRYQIANRGHGRSAVVFSLEQLPAATLSIAPNPVPVDAGATEQGTFEISRPLASGTEEVDHFNIVGAPVGGGPADAFPMTFLSPPQRNPQ
ncbi:MAG TPA: 4Fe-4S dicluster domain-containing protein [Bryobacteraceae bacterium]|nr:4Fe-4S dicluster domain-containing protein [Bryobacteraceae bacterium]